MKSEANVGFYTCTSQSVTHGPVYVPQEEHLAGPSLSVCALNLKEACCSRQGHFLLCFFFTENSAFLFGKSTSFQEIHPCWTE